MAANLERFRADYASAFESHLAGASTESGLESAYELGREAVTGELGLLDLAGIHHAVLAESLAKAAAPEEIERIATAGTDFFLESLSTFEMTQRGFREAQETALFQREIAATLQRHLLPSRLAEVPGTAAAARYLAGGAGVEVGGDWYEVLGLSGGRVGVAIGDVVGRGVRAAAIMGQLRVALRAYALEFDEPAVVARRLAYFVQTLDVDQMTTCVYAVLDPETGLVRFTNAGHPPPLVLGPDGSARYLEGGRSMPLGVSADTSYEEATARLEAGSTVLLYTDGLVEERGEPLDIGLERLRQAVTDGPNEPEALCDHVLEQLAQGAPGDDVAVLAVRSAPLGSEPLELTLPAEPATLTSLRQLLGRWLERAGASQAEAYDITLAATEAAANAVEHAYGPDSTSFSFSIAAEGGEVMVGVRDSGKWRPERNSARGRGLGVMRNLMDDVEVDRGEAGTHVRLRRRLGEEADDPGSRADRV